MTIRDLLPLSTRELQRLLVQGAPVDPSVLADRHFRGTSLGVPAFVERLTWKSFRKSFHREPETDVLRGWNVRLEQTGIEGPSVPKTRKNGSIVSFGHFGVVPAQGRRVPGGAEQSLLLDYGLGGNPAFEPTSLVRDPLVLLDDGLLLGWSYLELGRFRLGTPSYFVLRDDGPLDAPVPPPRPALKPA